MSLTYAHHHRGHNGAKMEDTSEAQPPPASQQPQAGPLPPTRPSISAPVIGNINSPSVSVASVSSEDDHHRTRHHPNSVENPDPEAANRYLQLELQRLTEAMGRLRRAYPDTADRGSSEFTRSVTTERLGEMLGILRPLLTRYPDLKTTEVMGAAENLIEQVRHSSTSGNGSFGDFQGAAAEDFFEALDALGTAIHHSVTDYVSSEAVSGSGSDLATSGRLTTGGPPRTSPNIVFPSYAAPADPMGSSSDPDFFGGSGLSAEATYAARRDAILSVDQVDAVLMRHDRGVDMALERAKIWSKYAKDVIIYVEKKIAIEQDWAKNLAKLAQERRPVLKEESHLPFQSNYCIALDLVSWFGFFP